MENDYRAENSANEHGGRDGGYKNYNRYNNDGERRPRRPRIAGNREGGERAYRSTSSNRYNANGDRPQRPRFNQYAEGGEQRAYRPRTNFNREEGYGNGGEHRPRFNANGGEQRSFRPRTNFAGNGERPQRPRYNANAEGGEQRSFRPRTNNGFGANGERPQRPQAKKGNRPQRQRTADYNPNAKYSMKKQIEYKDLLTDPNEPIRLNKFLANAGICSRREADEFIAAGVVSVNGVVVTELGTKIKRTDEVKFHDQPVSVERKAYVLLNKPKDCVTTSDDP